LTTAMLSFQGRGICFSTTLWNIHYPTPTSKEITIKESIISFWILYKYWTYFSEIQANTTNRVHCSNTN
jgi:hypothetical protein